MPILTKVKHGELLQALQDRYCNLIRLTEARALTSSSEGLFRSVYTQPDKMVATRGSSTEVSLALADFKAILTELGKLK